jgi:hypothetical protein
MTDDDEFQRPHPNTLNCADCGHVWFEGERRHQYVDAAGEVSIEADADAVCILCHQKRRRPRRDDDEGVRYW